MTSSENKSIEIEGSEDNRIKITRGSKKCDFSVIIGKQIKSIEAHVVSRCHDTNGIMNRVARIGKECYKHDKQEKISQIYVVEDGRL